MVPAQASMQTLGFALAPHVVDLAAAELFLCSLPCPITLWLHGESFLLQMTSEPASQIPMHARSYMNQMSMPNLYAALQLDPVHLALHLLLLPLYDWRQ